MSKKQQIHLTTTLKIIASILSVTIGVLSLIFLWGNGFPYTIYVPILMWSIAIASLLIFSCVALGILRHKKIRQEKIHVAAKWIYTFSSGIALLILAPLIIILFSAYGVSSWVIFPCFLIAVSLSVILIIFGIVKCINICQGSLEKEYTLFKGENCPCRKTSCEYHGDCAACIARHHNSNPQTETKCERLKAKMEREAANKKA